MPASSRLPELNRRGEGRVGLQVLLIAAIVASGSTAALFMIVFDLKARLEEAWLQERHPDYARYRERTLRRFVPGVD